MSKIRTSIAMLGVTTLLAAPLSAIAGPAHADADAAANRERVFRVAGARVDFSVERDDGRFEVDVDIDNARPGSRWRIVLWHNGTRFHNRVHRADREGDVDISKNQGDRAGADTFKVKVKKVRGAGKSRTIRIA
ncbi:hypothetical protein [Nocardioides dongkuii]|uniref:hypothetical protein n=1 Tax=Nocardioides dongkuii TaxID=2760089 RepID=UPI0018778307|nr:hypothetical protein [Nocardioides dongkuii]